MKIEDPRPFKVGNKFFCVHNMPGFWKYYLARGLTREDVMKLNPKDRLKLVLKWKWITDDWESARECEATRIEVVRNLINCPPTEEGDQYWLRNALKLEHVCDDIKGEIGTGELFGGPYEMPKLQV